MSMEHRAKTVTLISWCCRKTLLGWQVLRHQRLGWLAWRAGTDYIQPIGFTWEEFEQASALSLLGEIRERGIVVHEADSAERAS